MLLKYGIYENSLDTPIGMICQQMANYFQTTLNITYEFLDVTSEEVDAFYRPDDILKDGVDFFCMPFSMNGGFYYNFYTFSTPTMSSEVVLLSGIPSRKTQTSLNGLFIFSDAVTFGLITCVFLVAIVSSLIKITLYHHITFRWDFLKSIYSLSLSMFRVAIPNIPRSLSYRILMYVWLLVALIISVQQNSNFTTNLSLPVYFCINSFKDINLYNNLTVRTQKNNFEESYLINLGKTDETAKKISEKIKQSNNYYAFTDLIIEEDIRKAISEQRITVLINTMLLKVLASLVMMQDEGLRYYFSPGLTQMIQGFIMSKNVSSDIIEEMNVRMAYMYGCKSMERVLQLCDRYLEARLWEIPSSEDDQFISIEDSYLPLLVYLAGNTVGFIAFLIEVCFSSYTIIGKIRNEKCSPVLGRGQWGQGPIVVAPKIIKLPF